MSRPRRASSHVWCPVASCDYGETGGRALLRGRTMAEALRNRDAHVRSAHAGFEVPRGSLRDRVPRLD